MKRLVHLCSHFVLKNVDIMLRMIYFQNFQKAKVCDNLKFLRLRNLKINKSRINLDYCYKVIRKSNKASKSTFKKFYLDFYELKYL
ncbi:hypothetical protein BpHYR1_031332 [Brachionus plicatilis]|uniref:Uncharacterized protein n=1 Tax=Brachionus plicatilis TaxID=10195 RepID=A0A3M7QSL4_BRAPC|nr:hypothetical protein BpHYR1_031332 [Brachionus plicatilis]